MPSAEKVTSAAVKAESAPPSEPKGVENTQKENADQSEKSVPAIQQVISIISNKVRNLEKRKNKLDGYRAEEESGKELSSEQEKAVSKYDEVVQQLSLSKEFYKQFQVIASAASKDAKREARKTLFARQTQETIKIREVLLIQELLQRLKDDGIRRDFLSARNGACRLTKAEFELIDKIAPLFNPARPQFSNEPTFATAAKTSADNFSYLIDGRNRQILDTEFSFEKARDLFSRIQACGYWEKDVKFVAVVEESKPTNDTQAPEQIVNKDGKQEVVEKVLAPAPTQVPTPTFNGNVNQQQQQQQLHRVPLQPASAPTVTAVEKAYYNQLQYSGQQLMNNGPPQNDFGGANFSFLQDSELDSPAAPGSQPKMPVNVIQSASHQQQLQQAPQPTYKNANFHPQQSQMAGFPPGLNVQHTVSHIPGSYQPSPQQLNQQSAVPSSQVPPNMIPKQQQPMNGGGQVFGPSSQTPPIQQQQQQSSRSAYPTMAPKAQYQQQQNLQKPVASPKMDGAGDSVKPSVQREEKPREDYQQQPQIDTWTNETAAQSGSGNYQSRGSSGGGGFNRSNRSSGGGGGGSGNGSKYNNYRNSQQPRNFENGNGDSPREAKAPGTYYQNNERYNGSAPSGNRYEGRGGAGGGSGGNFKSRDGYRSDRTGSGRFAGSGSASAQGSSNPGQRK